jgi:hypothetical protein
MTGGDELGCYVAEPLVNLAGCKQESKTTLSLLTHPSGIRKFLCLAIGQVGGVGAPCGDGLIDKIRSVLSASISRTKQIFVTRPFPHGARAFHIQHPSQTPTSNNGDHQTASTMMGPRNHCLPPTARLAITSSLRPFAQARPRLVAPAGQVRWASAKKRKAEKAAREKRARERLKINRQRDRETAKVVAKINNPDPTNAPQFSLCDALR